MAKLSKHGKPIGRPAKNRQEVRETEVRQEEVRTAPREKRQRLQKYGEGQDRFSIPREMIPDGIDLQWVAYEILGQPAPQERVKFERNGWRPVLGQDFQGRFDGMFMPKGHKGEICVEGQVLMERPMELTIEARQEERQAAMTAVGVQERRLQAGQLDGVTLDTQHPTARLNTRLTRTVEAGIPVPDQ